MLQTVQSFFFMPVRIIRLASTQPNTSGSRFLPSCNRKTTWHFLIQLIKVMQQDFSKNLGLYGERVGCASVVCRTKAGREACDTQLRGIIRPMYSNPPKHGCYIAKSVLTKPDLFNEWVEELKYMSGRILEMRSQLRGELERIGTPGAWNHITDQIGMFSYTGLTKAQVAYIEKTYHIYMLSSGRISMAGVTSKNIPYLSKAIKDAVV